MITIQFDGLPFISPEYKGDHYRSIRYKIKEWMTRELKQSPSRIYVDMNQNRGTVTFKEQNNKLAQTVKMIWQHPMGQLFFDWNRRLKSNFVSTVGFRGPRPKFSLPGIDYVQRFAECRQQAVLDAKYLDQLIFEEEGILASMLVEIAHLEANQGLDQIDSQIDELQINSEPVNVDVEESHPLILEFSSDEEDAESSDEDELEELPDPPTKLPYHEYWVAVNKGTKCM